MAKPSRDEQRVRRRYLRMSEEALVERLLAMERTYAEQREHRFSQQNEVLTLRLRAEAAEARLNDDQRQKWSYIPGIYHYRFYLSVREQDHRRLSAEKREISL